ncbi:hypothetical protein Y032_0011g1337 [Ancylostoma ceylanicum]|uniref:C2H2-type domain-containing protein n=1 Tax=Ancylostoma ceylanicum TaxID=53326 RepID=A0A016VG14_9BILA|nr:hypothetical protein Y032_0011g1337 [Ancylostoma ceylanicum]
MNAFRTPSDSSATMRGRTISPLDVSPCMDSSTYVQINIYNTNIRALREHGVDFKHILKHIGCRSLIMDVPIPNLHSREFRFGTEASGGKSPDRSVTPESHSRASADGVADDDNLFENAASTYESRNHESGNSDKIIKEEPTSHAPNSSRDLDARSNTPAGDYRGDLGEEANFENCVHDDEQNASIYEIPATELFSNEPSGLKEQEEAPMSTMNHDKTLRETELADTVQAQPERSFMEFSRKIVNGILSVTRNRKEHSLEPTSSKTTENFVVSHDDSKECLELMAESDASYILADLTSNGAASLHGDELLFDNDLDLGEQNNLSSARSSDRRNRKRPLRSSLEPQSAGDGVEGEEGENAVGSSKRRSALSSEKEPERIFECKYPRCTAKISWRPRYGKNRLVDHVRVHWGKQVKQCCMCNYVATHQRKIHTHHRRFHPGVRFTGAVSLETKEDMDELMRLWKQCFPVRNEVVLCL